MAAATPMSSRSRRAVSQRLDQQGSASSGTANQLAVPDGVQRAHQTLASRRARAPGRSARRPVSSERGISRASIVQRAGGARAPAPHRPIPGAAVTSSTASSTAARDSAPRACIHSIREHAMASCYGEVVVVAAPGRSTTARLGGVERGRRAARWTGRAYAARPRIVGRLVGVGRVEVGERAVHLRRGLAVRAETGGLLGGGDGVRQRRWRSRPPGRRGGRSATSWCPERVSRCATTAACSCWRRTTGRLSSTALRASSWRYVAKRGADLEQVGALALLEVGGGRLR